MDLLEIQLLLITPEHSTYTSLAPVLSSLEKEHTKLHWVKDYHSGITWVEQHQPDLILVDYHLRDYTALDFMAHVRKNNCIKPVLILVDEDNPEAERRAIQAGAESYIHLHYDTEPESFKRALRNSIERSRALEAIRTSEARMRGIFYHSSIGISLVDLEGAVVQANPAFCKLVQYDHEEICGMDLIQDFTHPSDNKNLRDLFFSLVEGEEPIIQGLYKFEQKGGNWIWGEVTLSLFHETSAPPQFAICLMEDKTEQQFNQIALRDSEAQLKELSHQLLLSQENERRDISMELHDSIGGNLGALRYKLEYLKLEYQEISPRWQDDIAQIEDLIVETIDEVQRISTGLHPPMLKDLGIIPSLQWFLRKQQRLVPQLKVSLLAELNEKHIPEPLKISLFRICQEAINNFLKHGQGSAITITLEEKKHQLELEILDNGNGFDQALLLQTGSPKGMGLRNMIKRTELTGGAMVITTQTEKGTSIQATWPLVTPPEKQVPS